LGVKAVMNDGVGRRVGLQCCIISFAVYADSDELEVSSWSSKGAWRAPWAAEIGWRNWGKLEGTCKQWKV